MRQQCGGPSSRACRVGCGVVAAWVWVLGAGCGARAESHTRTKHTEDECADDACDNQSLPVVRLQRFSWTSRQEPVRMGTTRGRACFLTKVGGAFNSAEDEVHIVSDGDQWLLTGTTAVGGFVEAGAACVPAEGVTAELDWHQGEQAILLESETDFACFLTGAFGRFEGGAEVLSVARREGSWELSGRSQQDTLGGSARCLQMAATSDAFGMEFDTPSPLLSSAEPDGVCYLTVLCGDFGAEGDVVETEWNGSAWELRRRVGGARPLRASAACFGRRDESGLPPAG
jgi:hypothetical protein